MVTFVPTAIGPRRRNVVIFGVRSSDWKVKVSAGDGVTFWVPNRFADATPRLHLRRDPDAEDHDGAADERSDRRRHEVTIFARASSAGTGVLRKRRSPGPQCDFVNDRHLAECTRYDPTRANLHGFVSVKIININSKPIVTARRVRYIPRWRSDDIAGARQRGGRNASGSTARINDR